MRRFIALILLSMVLAPSAFAYRHAGSAGYTPAYVQDGNQELC